MTNSTAESSNGFETIRRLTQERHASEQAIWEATDGPAPPKRPEAGEALARDLAAVFLVAPPPAPTHRIAGDLKEAVILRRLALLSPFESLLARTRLGRNATDDELARAFRSLAEPRRSRIMLFLGDARRRAAFTTVTAR